MKNNKHTKFEQLLKNQLEEYELPYQDTEWEQFEKKLNKQSSFKRNYSKKINNFLKCNFKNLILLSSLLLNIIIVIYFMKFHKTNTQTVMYPQTTGTNQYSHNIEQNSENLLFLETKVDSLHANIKTITKLIEVFDNKTNTTQIVYYDTLNYSENIANYIKIINSKNDSTNHEIPKKKVVSNKEIDTTKIKTEKTTGHNNYVNIENTELDFFLVEDLKQPPMFKNNRGKYKYITHLKDYVSSEFKPSNLKEEYDGNYVCYLTFFINPDGTISEIFPVGYRNKPEIISEVTRVLESMSGWKAGENEKHEKVLTRINFIFEIELTNKNPFPNY